MTASALLLPALCLLLLAPGHAALAQDSTARLRLEQELRAVQAERTLQQEDGSEVSRGGFDREKLERVRHGLFSIVLPGWSQRRAGHDGRALAFASTELVIWSTWLFSRLQGDYREDRYREFAEQFAGVSDPDGRSDDYWRAVGRYGDVEEYNNRVRRDNRAAAFEQEFNGQPVTIGLNDGVIAPEDGWSWSSERRQSEYRELRGDSQSAYDRAQFVLLFALVNRVVAFADAVRSGPRRDDEDAMLLRAGAFELGLDIDPRPHDPGAALRVGARF